MCKLFSAVRRLSPENGEGFVALKIIVGKAAASAYFNLILFDLPTDASMTDVN